MSQIIKKFIGDNQVGAAKALLENNSALRARNAADSADVDLIKLDASDVPQLAAGTQVNGNAIATTATAATIALDNLASTAVNVSVLPGVDNSIDLGSGAKRWANAFLGLLKDASAVIAVDITNRLLKNSSGTTLIDFSGSNAQTSVAPSTGNDIANKTYVDSVASAQKTWNYEALTLNGTDITNQYKDLAHVAVTGSIFFYVDGVWQRPTTDYTISYTGGVGGNTRLTFAGDLATGGNAALISGDVIHIQYQY